jgi:hypothetical protein
MNQERVGILKREICALADVGKPDVSGFPRLFRRSDVLSGLDVPDEDYCFWLEKVVPLCLLRTELHARMLSIVYGLGFVGRYFSMLFRGVDYRAWPDFFDMGNSRGFVNKRALGLWLSLLEVDASFYMGKAVEFDSRGAALWSVMMAEPTLAAYVSAGGSPLVWGADGFPSMVSDAKVSPEGALLLGQWCLLWRERMDFFRMFPLCRWHLNMIVARVRGRLSDFLKLEKRVADCRARLGLESPGGTSFRFWEDQVVLAREVMSCELSMFRVFPGDVALFYRALGLLERKVEECRSELLLGHDKLVSALAGKYFVKMGRLVDFEDLCQEGWRAMMGAVEAYNPFFGRMFGAFARSRVEHSIHDYLNVYAGEVRLPAPQARVRSQVRKLTNTGLSLGEAAKCAGVDEWRAFELIMFGTKGVPLDLVSCGLESDSVGPAEAAAQGDMKEYLIECVKKWDNKHHKKVVLDFFQGLKPVCRSVYKSISLFFSDAVSSREFFAMYPGVAEKFASQGSGFGTLALKGGRLAASGGRIRARSKW